MIQMSLRAQNEAPVETLSNSSAITTTGSTKVWRSDSKRTMLLSPEVFIGLELSIVPQVQQVFVERIEQGKTMRVMVMVTDRDAAVRRRVYAREQEIIDAHPQFDFDFYLHPLMGRDPSDVVDGIGKLAYTRACS